MIYVILFLCVNILNRSWLKDLTPLSSDKIVFMSVTYHSPTAPCGPANQSPTYCIPRHSLTADLRSALSCGEKHVRVAMDPSESRNMFPLRDFELIHAALQSTCLKDVAPLNMVDMSMTWPTFHLDKSWLKDSAPVNILHMLVTLPTFHLDRSPLKDFAPLNILSMLVIWSTFHWDRSPLKALA